MNTREAKEASATDNELHNVRKAIKNAALMTANRMHESLESYMSLVIWCIRGTQTNLRPRALALAGTRRTGHSWHEAEAQNESHGHCRSCRGCQMVARPGPSEPLKPTPLPNGPRRTTNNHSRKGDRLSVRNIQ